MKIIIASMRFDYGDRRRGLSGMESYFEEPLKELGHQTIFFDFMETKRVYGKTSMNETLLALVLCEKPAVVLFVLFENEFLPNVIDTISTQTVTVAYFFDDTWRTDYSRFWAPHFVRATTSDVNGVARWRELGCFNFMYVPFSINERIFRKKTDRKIYDVSFVGGYHPYRAWLISILKSHALRVSTWGHGWPEGRLDQDGMIKIFNESRINLNLSNNDSLEVQYLFSPLLSGKDMANAWRSVFRILRRRDAKVREMVKGRHFEIAACGGFQLSYYVEGLERHFKIGHEIAVYGSVTEMVEKAIYYLKHEDEREAIAEAGSCRTSLEHSSRKRFADMLSAVEMTSTSP